MQINKNFMAFGPLNVSEVGVAHGQWAGGILCACVSTVNSECAGKEGGGKGSDVTWCGVLISFKLAQH